MKTLCKLCYRLLDDSIVKKDYCLTCLSILGKGAGYGKEVDDKKANEWFEGIEKRKEERVKEGYKL